MIELIHNRTKEKILEDEKLIERVRKISEHPMTHEEWKAQRVSYIMSGLSKKDDSTRKRIEDYVNQRYGKQSDDSV